MAIPGKIDSPLSQGAHSLIKQGARLVESVEDVMEALGYVGEQLKTHTTLAAREATEKVEAPLFDTARFNLKGHEKTIYEALGKEPAHIDQLIADTDLPAGAVNAAVMSLRLKGLIKQLPGNLFAKR
jgi:DNA processing protein